MAFFLLKSKGKAIKLIPRHTLIHYIYNNHLGKQRGRVYKILIMIISKRHRLQQHQTLQGMSNSTFQSTKKTREPFTPPQLQKGTGRTTRFEWSELYRREENTGHLLKAKRWHWRQQAAAAGTGTVTFQHSHRLWHATGIAFPPAHMHRRTMRGTEGQ